MRFHGLRILILLWACWWFGIVVPGHERGQIKLPGGGDCAMCREAGASAPAAPHSQSSKSKPDPAANCAICFLTAQLQTPPVVDLTLPQVGLLRVLPVLPLNALEGVRFISVIRERGPPGPFSA